MLAGDVTSWRGVHWRRPTLISFLVQKSACVKQIIIAGVTPLFLLWIKVDCLLLMWLSFGHGSVNSRFSRFVIIYFIQLCFVSDWTSGKDLVSPFVAQRLLQSWPTWSREKQRSDKRNLSFWDSPSYSPFQATFLAAVAWRQWFHE